MKINFKQFKMYADLGKTKSFKQDVTKLLANTVYQSAPGIEALNTALKIYNSKGEEEYSDLEVRVIRACSEKRMGCIFVYALQELIEEEKKKKRELREEEEKKE